MMNDVLAAEPAAQPGALSETTPGVMEGEILGHLGAGGAALVVTVVLALGMKASGKGKPLPWGVVLVLGMMAATLYAAAGGLWSLPADLLGSVMASLGVGQSDGMLGHVGMGAVACCTAAWIYWRKLSLNQVAIWGFVMAYVAGRAGGVWGIGAEVVTRLASVIGA